MYFEVLAKCGHVGRNNYVVKPFYIKAESAKEAAKRIRSAPRVKHHHKDAIRGVREIDCQAYEEGIIKTKEDPYFNIDNSSDQKRIFVEDVLEEETYEFVRTREVGFKMRKWKILEREAREMILGVCYG